MQRLCQRDLVYLDQLPISFRQNAVADATWREDRRNVFERLSQAVAHFVYVIPLLLGHRCTHVVRRHLSFVEQPLENEQGGGQRWIQPVAEVTSPRFVTVFVDAIVRHSGLPKFHSLVNNVNR